MLTPTSADAQRAFFAALNRVVKPLAKRGVVSPWPLGGGVVVLETVGRKTGKAREVPLVAARAGDTVVVSTVRSSSQWVANAEAQPAVHVWVGGRKVGAIADVSRGPLTTVVLDLADAEPS